MAGRLPQELSDRLEVNQTATSLQLDYSGPPLSEQHETALSLAFDQPEDRFAVRRLGVNRAVKSASPQPLEERLSIHIFGMRRRNAARPASPAMAKAHSNRLLGSGTGARPLTN